HTFSRIVSEWCDTTRWRGRASANCTRSAATGTPPRAWGAFGPVPPPPRAAPPRRIGPEVPRPATHHDDIGLQHLLGRKQGGPDRHCLELPPEGLSTGDEPVHEPGFAEPSNEPRERTGK